MAVQRANGDSVSRLTAHLVWSAKYRYSVLEVDIQILKGVVSKDHIHMHIEYRPSMSLSYLIKKLKGRSSLKLQQEFPVLKSKYWDLHFWAIGYGCWSTGDIYQENKSIIIKVIQEIE